MLEMNTPRQPSCTRFMMGSNALKTIPRTLTALTGLRCHNLGEIGKIVTSDSNDEKAKNDKLLVHSSGRLKPCNVPC
jgi:hypothetical protein